MICTLKAISEDLRQHSNGSAGRAAEWDLPNREKRGCFWFPWAMRRAALHHGNSYLSLCSVSSEGWGSLNDTNYLSTGVWRWVFQAQWSEVAVAQCRSSSCSSAWHCMDKTSQMYTLPKVTTCLSAAGSKLFVGKEGKGGKQQSKERESNQ